MTQEKRSFFRITDDLILDYRQVDAFTADNQKSDSIFPESAALTLFAEFRRLDTDSAQLLTGIGETNRALADYLAILNRKVELLTQQVMASQHQNTMVKPTRVNISEGGIAFISEKSLYKGSFLALRLLFLPSFMGVTTFARVIRCDESSEKTYQIAAKFYHIGSTQQQILSRQIMQQQIKAKKDSESKEAL